MKNIIINFSLILLFTLPFFNAIEAQVVTDKLQCGEKGIFKLELTEDTRICYLKDKYGGVLERARKAFKEYLLGRLDCNNFVCFDRTLFHCDPKIIGNIQGNLTSSGNEFCSGTTIQFNWECSDCCRNTPTAPTGTLTDEDVKNQK